MGATWFLLYLQYQDHNLEYSLQFLKRLVRLVISYKLLKPAIFRMHLDGGVNPNPLPYIHIQLYSKIAQCFKFDNLQTTLLISSKLEGMLKIMFLMDTVWATDQYVHKTSNIIKLLHWSVAKLLLHIGSLCCIHRVYYRPRDAPDLLVEACYACCVYFVHFRSWIQFLSIIWVTIKCGIRINGIVE